MKCKLNDLCFVIKANQLDHVGKVVRCKEYVGYFIEGESYLDFMFTKTDHFWLVEGNFGTENSYAVTADSDLTPIKS